MAPSALTRFLPAPSTLVATALVAALAKAPPSRSLSLVKRFIALIFILNWRSWPGWWHVQLWGLVPALHLRLKLRGIDKTLSIGQDPLEKRVISKGFVTYDLSDWNGHLSNTSYGKIMDSTRFEWLLEVVGPSMGVEGVWSPLGGTAYAFFSELPMLAHYEVDVHVSSWDDKWVYYVARFTTAPKRGSTERTLHCVALNRSCFKIRGSRLSIPPARVLSLSGLGPDRTNWERTLQLRKEKKGAKWLKYGGALVAKKNGTLPVGTEPQGEEGWEVTGMEGYEERRLKGMEVVGRFGDVRGWKEL